MESLSGGSKYFDVAGQLLLGYRKKPGPVHQRFSSVREVSSKRRRGISALSNASIISPIAEVDWSNSEHRLRICSDILDKVQRNVLETEDLSLFNANDY